MDYYGIFRGICTVTNIHTTMTGDGWNPTHSADDFGMVDGIEWIPHYIQSLWIGCVHVRTVLTSQKLCWKGINEDWPCIHTRRNIEDLAPNQPKHQFEGNEVVVFWMIYGLLAIALAMMALCLHGGRVTGPPQNVTNSVSQTTQALKIAIGWSVVSYVFPIFTPKHHVVGSNYRMHQYDISNLYHLPIDSHSLVIAFFGISSPQFQLWYWANSHLFFASSNVSCRCSRTTGRLCHSNSRNSWIFLSAKDKVNDELVDWIDLLQRRHEYQEAMALIHWRHLTSHSFNWSKTHTEANNAQKFQIPPTWLPLFSRNGVFSEFPQPMIAVLCQISTVWGNLSCIHCPQFCSLILCWCRFCPSHTSCQEWRIIRRRGTWPIRTSCHPQVLGPAASLLFIEEVNMKYDQMVEKQPDEVL